MFRAFVVALLAAALLAQIAHTDAPPGTKRTGKLSSTELHKLSGRVSVRIVAGQSIGSGVWISEDYVATCWHVVKALQVSVNVQVAIPTWFDAKNRNIVWGSFGDYTGTVVAQDEDSDIALIRVKDSPFRKSPGVFIKIDKAELKAQVAMAKLHAELPEPGTSTLLAGFPLGRPEVLAQIGNVAGIGLVLARNSIADVPAGVPSEEYWEKMRRNQEKEQKQLRVFVSVVSNPANSGGPVLDENGRLIGLLQGNLSSPSRDEIGGYAVYARPMRDREGRYLLDVNGKLQLEPAPMLENSGISVVIPVFYLLDLAKECSGDQGKCPELRGLQSLNGCPARRNRVPPR